MGNGVKEFGVIGLGRMGGNLVLHALEQGMHVVGYDVHQAPEELVRAGMGEIRRLDQFRDHLAPPRAEQRERREGRVGDFYRDETEGAAA